MPIAIGGFIGVPVFDGRANDFKNNVVDFWELIRVIEIPVNSICLNGAL